MHHCKILTDMSYLREHPKYLCEIRALVEGTVSRQNMRLILQCFFRGAGVFSCTKQGQTCVRVSAGVGLYVLLAKKSSSVRV